MNDVLTIVLGGGRGTRLFPLTHLRSKPAVPIGGKYRLIDIPLSNCLHAGLKRIYVLTQFNSASLNRHIGRSYQLDNFSDAFVEVLAAEQTPEGEKWFQGTADAVRQATRHFRDADAEYYLILAGDHVYRMDFASLIDAHIERNADITIAAQPVTPADATQMGIFRFSTSGQVTAFEEKPNAERLAEMGSSAPRHSPTDLTDDKPFVASMGIYVFSRDVLHEVLARSSAVDFGREIIPAALATHRVHPYLYRGFWADVGTVQSFYDVNLMLTRRGAPFNFFHPKRPIYTREMFLPAARIHDSHLDEALVAEGAYLDTCDINASIVGLRMNVRRGARITRSILLGADYFDESPGGDQPLGIGRDVVLDRVIVDKNARVGHGARLVNERGIDNADGDGYYIRGGIIIVPKGGVVKPGTVV
jgi:glucose-1-phosphate adenylyltransferase